MFCSNCGKQIPADSIYCLYCGKLLKDTTKAENVVPSLRVTPAISIEDLGFWLQGPVEKKSGSLFSSKNKIGRGFCFAFCLYDANGKETASDGLITVVINAQNDTYGSDEYQLKHHAKGGGYRFYATELLIKKTDFVTDQSRETESTRNKLAYVHRHLEPSIFIEENLTIYLHLWFRIIDGRLLYKRSGWLNWGNY
jgi:hypothetical protein